MTSRRQFLAATSGLTLAGAAGLWPLSRAFALPRRDDTARKTLNLLILGGTGFLGPHIVRRAIERGHAMTLFNRGRTNTDLFPDLPKLRGDRNSDVSALEGTSWDAVIDTSGYYPRQVRMIGDALGERISQYVFVSTISVYAGFAEKFMDEDAPLGTIEDETVEDVTGETYGPLKALCEQAAERAWPGRTANIRPGLIVGPGDPTDRFTYWPVRVSRGGEVLAPGTPGDGIQFIDGRDLANWIIHCVEANVTGVYNAISPPGHYSIEDLLTTCRTVSDSDASFTWASAAFLREQGVRGWADMPCWLPPEGEFAGFGHVNTARADDAGLKHRPLADIVRDTLEWHATRPDERRSTLRAGITAEREREVLAAWHARE